MKSNISVELISEFKINQLIPDVKKKFPKSNNGKYKFDERIAYKINFLSENSIIDWELIIYDVEKNIFNNDVALTVNTYKPNRVFNNKNFFRDYCNFKDNNLNTYEEYNNIIKSIIEEAKSFIDMYDGTSYIDFANNYRKMVDDKDNNLNKYITKNR